MTIPVRTSTHTMSTDCVVKSTKINKQRTFSYANLGLDPLRELTCINNDQENVTVLFTFFFRDR